MTSEKKRTWPSGPQATTSTARLAIRGVMFNWMGRGCSFVITFITTPLILHGLGNEAYGLWAIVMSVGGYYALADFGLRTGCVKYIAQFEATGDRAALRRMACTAFTAYTGLALLVLLASGPITWAFPYIFEIRSESVHTLRLAVFLIGVTVAIRLHVQVFRAIISAFKRFDVANVIAVATQLLQAGLIIGAVLAGYGLIGMAVAVLAVTCLNCTVHVLIASRLLGGPPLRPALDLTSFKLLFHFGSLNFLRQAAHQVHGKAAPLIAGFFLGPAMVPFFAIAHSLIEKTTSLTAGIASVVMPVASQLDAQKRQKEMARMMLVVSRVFMCISLLLAVFSFVFADEFIAFWIGAEYVARAHPILCVLAVANVFRSVSGGLRSILIGNGHLSFATKVGVYMSCMSLGLSVLFVPWMGLMGLAWAVLAPTALFSVVILPRYCCRLYEYSWGRYLLQVVVRPSVATIPTLMLAIGLARGLPPSNMLYLLMEVGAITVVMSASAFFFCMDASLRAEVLQSVVACGPKGQAVSGLRKRPNSVNGDTPTVPESLPLS